MGALHQNESDENGGVGPVQEQVKQYQRASDSSRVHASGARGRENSASLSESSTDAVSGIALVTLRI